MYAAKYYAKPNHAFSKWACENGYLFLSVIDVFRPALNGDFRPPLTIEGIYYGYH